MPRSAQRLLRGWITGSRSLAESAKRCRVSVRTAQRRLVPAWQSCPLPWPYAHVVRVLVLDAVTVIPQQLVVLVARDADRGFVVSWRFVTRENFAGWDAFFATLPEPAIVVCDGQKGLLKAVSLRFPHAHVQRCLIHVTRQANAWLTRRPQTEAGRELKVLVNALHGIRTRRQKRRWIRWFNRWQRRHERFLKERTYSPTNPRRWWYTHRKLRAVRSLIHNAVPDLFRFVTNPNVPRTSNHVEGGINSRLKELFRLHRGLAGWKKTILVAHYLRMRQR